jgi:coenzyme F420-0:L-glutamate ligase/coenzyme F420-1:gamma-L-glutamate ligase
MDVIAYELTAAAALLFGQTDEGIPVAIVRGMDYAPSESANISNTLATDRHQLRETIKSTIKATANIRGLKNQMLSRGLRLFVKY